jgi:hypothetical protein
MDARRSVPRPRDLCLDGLANLGLILVTYPIGFLGAVLTELFNADDAVLLPRVFGYLEDHAVAHMLGR